MHKVIPNADALEQFQKETENTLSLWRNQWAVERIRETAEKIDACYGADRDIVANLGGYILILYGNPDEMEKEYHKALQHYHMEEDLYEFEEKYQNEGDMVLIRLYICSSDYAVTIVMVQ